MAGESRSYGLGVAVGGEGVDVDALGPAYEASLAPTYRHRRGAFFTPPTVAAGLLEAAVTAWPPGDRPFRVCDPSCGGGVFLLAAGRHLEQRFGLGRAEIVSELLWGVDVAPDAAAVTRAALSAWVAEQDPAAVVTSNVVVADTLIKGTRAWPAGSPAFDLVIGNPPFQNQLSAGTARSSSYARRVRKRLGPAATAYADAASLFLVAGLDLVRPGGRVALILPESFLAARDAAPARVAMTEGGRLVGLWLDGENLFDAAVRVCAPIVDRHDDDAQEGEGAAPALRRWVGPAVAEAPPRGLRRGEPDADTWAPLLADLRRLPDIELDPTRTLGSMVETTAGFRDQFYGLIPFVSEAEADQPRQPDQPRPGQQAKLVTSGLIDPANALWGRRTTRFGGVSWAAPVIDLDRLRDEDPKLWAWGRARLAPKVLLATQTRVLEALVDRDGTCWPSVPVVAVGAPVDRLSHVAAVLLAPPVSVWTMGSFGGTALSADALKLAARQVLDVPLPVDDGAWDRGAAAFERAEGCAADDDEVGWSRHIDELGAHMCEAYRVGTEVLDWWRARLPPFRS